MKVFSKAITVKLDRAHADKLERLAKKRALTQSDVVREALDAMPEDAPSGLAGVEDLVGAFGGPSDLATNPKHLRGFGRDHRRHRAARRAS
jgi:predicted DNA-binding protein